MSYDKRRIRVGDVIVFVPPDRDEKIVHRVITVGEKGIRTRRDNFRMGFDRWLLKPSDIIGRVIYAERGRRRLRVFGGLIGQMHVILIGMRRISISALSFIFGYLYRGTARAGIFKGWVKTRVFVFNKRIGKEIYILAGSRLIGRYGAGKGYIRRPFRLFVGRDFLKQ